MAGVGLFGCPEVIAQETNNEVRPYSFSFTTRIHSISHFPMGGVYVNNNPTMDFDASLDIGNTSVFAFRSADLVDSGSPLNYATIGLSRTVGIGEGFDVIPAVGYFLSQNRGFRGPESDAWTAVTLKKRITQGICIYNTTMMGNLVVKEHTPSFTNRLKINFTFSGFELDAFIWYSQTLKQPIGYTSGSLGISTPKIPISKAVSLKMHCAYQQFISSEQPESAMNKGILFSLILPVEFNLN